VSGAVSGEVTAAWSLTTPAIRALVPTKSFIRAPESRKSIYNYRLQQDALAPKWCKYCRLLLVLCHATFTAFSVNQHQCVGPELYGIAPRYYVLARKSRSDCFWPAEKNARPQGQAL
jgi:hypothetical protein